MKPYFTPEASSILQGLLCLDVDNIIFKKKKFAFSRKKD